MPPCVFQCPTLNSFMEFKISVWTSYENGHSSVVGMALCFCVQACMKIYVNYLTLYAAVATAWARMVVWMNVYSEVSQAFCLQSAACSGHESWTGKNLCFGTSDTPQHQASYSQHWAESRLEPSFTSRLWSSDSQPVWMNSVLHFSSWDLPCTFSWILNIRDKN